MLVKTLVSWAGRNFSYAPGDTVDIPDNVARERIGRGLCVEIGVSIKDASQSATLVPSLSERSPKYAELTSKIEAMSDEARSLSVRIETIKKARAAESGKPVDTERAQRISQLLGRAAVPELGSEAEDLTALDQKRTDLLLAIDLLERERVEERLSTSRLICEEVQEVHAKHVADICASLIDTLSAWQRYAAFTGSLTGRDIAWSSLRPMHPLFLADGPIDTQGHLALYLRDAVRHGFISADTVPEALRNGRAGANTSTKRSVGRAS
jgi:hypothetical protein